jgi:broad specificity phosphatase PhoE
MGIAIYLSHPEVTIDPFVAVPQWSLSEKGRARAGLFGQKLETTGIRRIVASAETKAVETAEIIAGCLALTVEIVEETGENDRSATGFVPPDQFAMLADAFFAAPDQSIRGWETARAAQSRITTAVERVLKEHGKERPILFVGHGAVGTLLWCALRGLPISCDYDQSGAGNAYAFTLASRRVLCEWTAIEDWEQSLWPES